VTQPPSVEAGPVYAEFIRAQLAEERTRKTSLESRGTVIITSAGTLTTFLFGLSAFSKSAGTSFQLTILDSIALMVALSSLLLAAAFGLAANRIRSYSEPTIDYMERLVKPEYWNWNDANEAARLMSESDVETLAKARTLNDSKANRVIWALRLETLAILALSFAVVFVLFVRR
jgi:hypothetical protein